MSSNAGSIYSQRNLKTPNRNAENDFYEFDRFRLDVAHLMLYENEAPVSLAPKVIETLLALIESSGEVVGKEELMTRLWSDSFVEEANLTQNVYLLRKTLGNASNGEPLIETFRRRGYRFNGKLRAQTSNKDALEIRESDLRRTEPWGGYAPLKSRIYIFAGAGVIAVILLAAGTWYLILPRNGGEVSPTISQNLSFTRLTSGLNAYSPAISPDGRYLAYCLSDQNGHSLWVKDMVNSQASSLTKPVIKSCNHPMFSPDNRQVYFVDQRNTLSSIPVSGGESTEIIRSAPNPFALSPDGRQVAFIRGPNLVVAATDGTGETKLSERDGESRWYSSLAAQLTWSPDGERIVVSGGYVEKGQKAAELIEVFVASGAERRIPIPRWDAINSVAWSADEKSLFVTARERNAEPMQIWRVSYPDGSVSKITNDLQSYARLTITNDSRILLAEKAVGACNVWIGSLDDPGSIRQITFDDGDITGRSGLVLTPDNKIIFTASYSGNLDLWKIDHDGGGLKQLTANAGDRNIRPQITNDGKYIVFSSRAAGTTRRNILRIDADGGNPLQLTNGGQDYPAVSPDGKWVYFTDIAEKISSVWKVSIDGGEISRVTGNYPAYIPTVSPDGTMLAFVYGGDSEIADSGNLAILKLDSGEPPKIFDAQPFRGVSQWSADHKSLLYIQKGSPNLWRQPIDGSPPVQVTNLGLETTWNFTVSQNSDKIVIARGNAATEAILITNFR